jgi:hypothetical protein
MSVHLRPRCRPAVEALEGRCLPSSIPCGQVATVQIGLLVNDQGAPLSAGQQIDAHTHFNPLPNLVLNPGSSVQFAAELLDAKGNVLGFGRSQDLSPQGIKLQFGYANYAQLRNQISKKMLKNMLKQLHISPGPGALQRLERHFAKLNAEVASLNPDTGALVPLPGRNELSVGATAAAQDFSGKACGTASQPTLVTRPSNKEQSRLFDGSYQGTYSGMACVTGSHVCQQESGAVRFSIRDRLITVEAPASASGMLPPSGSATFTASVMGVRVTFGGTVGQLPGGVLFASGTWTIDDPNFTGSGFWSASSSPGLA